MVPVISLNGTILTEDRDGVLIAREKLEPAGPVGKLLGALAGIAFLAVAGLFFTMPLNESGTGTETLRYLLCGGIALIGLIVLWSVFARKKSGKFIEIDRTAREIRFGSFNEHRDTIRGRMPFDGLKRFHAGSIAQDELPKTGSTVLYAKGEGAPGNGALMIGSVDEIEALADAVRQIVGRPL